MEFRRYYGEYRFRKRNVHPPLLLGLPVSENINNTKSSARVTRAANMARHVIFEERTMQAMELKKTHSIWHSTTLSSPRHQKHSQKTSNEQHDTTNPKVGSIQLCTMTAVTEWNSEGTWCRRSCRGRTIQAQGPGTYPGLPHKKKYSHTFIDQIDTSRYSRSTHPVEPLPLTVPNDYKIPTISRQQWNKRPQVLEIDRSESHPRWNGRHPAVTSQSLDDPRPHARHQIPRYWRSKDNSGINDRRTQMQPKKTSIGKQLIITPPKESNKFVKKFNPLQSSRSRIKLDRTPKNLMPPRRP